MKRDRRLVQRTPALIELSRGRSVLHLGCTNWPYTAESLRSGALLHQHLRGVASELWGLDEDPLGLQALQDLGFDRLIQGDLLHLDQAVPFVGTAGAETAAAEGPTALGPFDLVIAGEVIEHLSNPAAMLQGIKPLLAPDGELVVTVPSAYCAFRFASYAASGVRGNPEPVHPDHVAYYSETTLTHLLDIEGYDVVDLSFYDLGTEHRSSAPRWWRLVNDVAVRFAPQLGDGVVARCRVRPT